MRRIVALFAALLLALIAYWLVIGDSDLNARLRDGGLMALLAVAIAAWNAAGYPLEWNRTTWSPIARALIGGGIVTAIIAIPLRWWSPGLLPKLPEIVWAVGMVAALAGMLIPAVITRFAPPIFTWTKGSDGQLTRKATNAASEAPSTLVIGRTWIVAFLCILVAGIVLRVWTLSELPSLCRTDPIAGECQTVLHLAPDVEIAQTLPFASALVIPLARLLGVIGNWRGGDLAEPLWALRWAVALISMLTIPALALALRPMVAPGGILLGVAIYALHPLFVGAATSDLAVEPALWLLLAMAGSASALRSHNPRGWALAGLMLGLLVLTTPAWLIAWIALLLLFILLLLLRSGTLRTRENGVAVGLLLAGVTAGAALSAISADNLVPAFASDIWTREFAQNASEWFQTLPAGSGWVLALGVVGVGGALRLRRQGALLIAAALIVSAIALPLETASRMPILIFVALFAAIGADQLLRATQRTLSPVARPTAMLALALIALSVLSLWNFQTWHSASAANTLPADDRALVAATDFIRSARDNPVLDRSTWLLAPSLYNHPGLRSAAAAELEEGRLQPFSAVGDLPYANQAPGGINYLFPVADQQTLQTLQMVYPEGHTLPLAAADSADALIAFRVDPALIFDSTGLAQFVYQGAEFGSADEAAMALGVGPLYFEWGTTTPADAPFSVEWDGSLLVDRAGATNFNVTAPPGSTFSMTLDDRLILDTSLGLSNRTETLPAGTQRLKMRYRSGSEAGDLVVAWQPPGEELHPIPRERLYNPAVPDMGLLGNYSAGSAWDGVVLAQRKDMQIIPDATLELPWGVVWQGYLAAPRAGEYLIGAVTNGALMMDLGGNRLLTHTPGTVEEVEPPVEGTIYLEQGWHPVTIRFAPNANATLAPELRLYWQPPGNQPGPLLATYFTPAVGDIEVTRPLPTLPDADPRLGDDDFALSADSMLWMPTTVIPPTRLPLLPFELTETYGSCGAAEGQFNGAHGIAWDGAQDLIYIADTMNARVVALNLADGSQRTLPIPDLEEPVDVALTPSGDLLVLDTVQPKLLQYAPASEQITSLALPPGFYRPRGLSTDASGLIYIADTGGARVVALTATGELLAAFGGSETRLGKGQPVAVGVTPRTLWALAAEDGRLWQLTTLGSLAAIQSSDTINGPHITTYRDSSDGSLFISDPARHQVMYLAESGRPLGVLADEDAFDQPTGVAALQRGDETLLAVMDTARCALTTWQAQTSLLQQLTTSQ